MRLCSGLRWSVCKGEMSLLLQILFWVAMSGTLTSTIYCLMVIAAAVRFGVRKRREDRAEATFLPRLERVEAAAWDGAGAGAEHRDFF